MVIVNDGGNKSDVESLVKEYEENFNGRLRIVHKETSSGMEAASNSGIVASESEYIVIHDDDDSWHPDFLEECVGFLERNKDIKGVISHSLKVIESVTDKDIIIEKIEPFNNKLKTIVFFKLAAYNLFPPISFVYRREVFEKVGFYNEELPVLGDWEFNLRFISEYDICVIKKNLANYHHRLDRSASRYSNSVIGDKDEHFRYDTILRNKLLREDLKNNKLGIGFISNIAKDFDSLRRLHYQSSLFSRIKNKLHLRKK